MDLSTLLSRAQFGFTIGFHILFPTLNIGLAVFLAIMEGCWLKTKEPVYREICEFWIKIFALTFGMGVVSGIVLSYELGTNFGPFIKAFGAVLGPLFGYEVLSAFFLEAGFLGIMLFGWNKVGPRLHYTATLMVAIGTTISAFWIMSANSWMQTPAGYQLVAGKYIVTDWLAVVFNPSFLPRFIHMSLASYTTACFVIISISAWFLLKQRHIELAKRCFSFTLVAALIVTPLQIAVGDVVGVKDYEHQPLKTAAMEGLWNTTRGAPLILFALPDTKQEVNHYAIEIPRLASLINTHSLQGELIGLKSVAPEDRPIVPTVFFAFRVMVGVGVFLLGIAFIGLYLRLRKQLYASRLFLRLCVLTAPLGFIATIAGWLTAESGRQPWVVYQLMRTVDGASHVAASQVITSLIILVLVYGVVFGFYLFYLLALIRKGPIVAKSTEESEPPFVYMGNKS